ncbi:hypothetical protein [Peribacillus simplex]|uniref:hypothetical protein n=1 Tax=Peribacillus simplex TaxID=1478 RepID=UPI003D2D5E78
MNENQSKLFNAEVARRKSNPLSLERIAGCLSESTTGLYRIIQDSFREKRQTIQVSKDYFARGKQKLTESLQRRKTIELKHLVRSQRSLFDQYVSGANKGGESFIHAKTPKVVPVKGEHFNKQLQEVTTEILLCNAKQGKQLLSTFLKTVDEHAFAAQIKNEFLSLIQPNLSDAGSDMDIYRQELFGMFEEVKTCLMEPETGEAMSVVEYAQATMHGKFFVGLVEEKAGEHLGKLARMYINKPEQYFADFPDNDKKLLLPENKYKMEVANNE